MPVAASAVDVHDARSKMGKRELRALDTMDDAMQLLERGALSSPYLDIDHLQTEDV